MMSAAVCHSPAGSLPFDRSLESAALTINVTKPAIAAVRPIVDYEPPAREIRQCPQRSSAVLRRRSPGITHHPEPAKPAEPMPSTLRPAAVFAEAALRRVLEVIDRRRPASQLRPLLAGPLVDSVLAANQNTPGQHAAAVLRRIRLQAVGSSDPVSGPAAAEVFGTFTRGRRIHAIACRVAQVRAADTMHWQVVALHIG